MCSRRRPAPPPPPPPPEPIIPPPAPPTQAAPEVKKARKTEKVKASRLQGRKSTILTGPRGVLDEAEVGKKTLLGH